jgi:hypothetical protein
LDRTASGPPLAGKDAVPPRIEAVTVVLDPAQTETLARALGDSPETVISLHLLRRGLGRAWVAGTPASPRAVVVENLAFDLGEPMAFGTDPAEI